MNFAAALQKEIASHPCLQGEDLLKFAYQAAFGCEHLVASASSAKAFFEAEFLTAKARRLPLYEDVGNGYVRVALGAWKNEALPSEDLFRLFLASATPCPQGSRLFPRYLSVVAALLRKEPTAVSPQDWEDLIRRHAESGGGPVHHSEAYRKAYDPHYRLVKKSRLQAYLSSRKAKGPLKRSPSLKTDRLLLRPFKESDIPAVHAWCSSTKVTASLFWLPHRDMATTKRLVKNWMRRQRNYAWALTKDDLAIGEIEAIKDLKDGGVEIGYLLSESEWHKGYMSEALTAVIRYLSQEAGYSYFIAEVDAHNLASTALLSRLGFQEIARESRFLGKKQSWAEIIRLRLEVLHDRF